MSEMRKITAGPHDQANWLMPMFDARRFDLLDANGDLRVEASGKSALRLSAGGPGGCVLLFGGEDGAEGE